MTADRQRRVAWTIVVVSFVVLLGGAGRLVALLSADREAVAAGDLVPARGAATAMAGMALGVGVAGIIGGIAGLRHARRAE